jgi:hypothetical protein
MDHSFSPPSLIVPYMYCVRSLFYTSGGLGFSYCSGAACGADLAEQGVFGPFCAFKKDNKPREKEQQGQKKGVNDTWISYYTQS